MTARRPGAPRRAGRPVSSSAGRSSSRATRAERSTSTSRPAGAARRRRTATPTAQDEAPVWGITRRSLVLIALIVLALATLVPTVNRYVTQRQQLAAAQQQVAQQRKDVKELQAQVDRWDDPTFVAAQARERLLFAMPGETQYRLTDTSGKEVPVTEAQRAAAAPPEQDWFDTMWSSVEGSSRLRPQDIPDSSAPVKPGSTSSTPRTTVPASDGGGTPASSSPTSTEPSSPRTQSDGADEGSDGGG